MKKGKYGTTHRKTGADKNKPASKRSVSKGKMYPPKGKVNG